MDKLEVKDAVEDLNRTWKAFREENDKKSGRNEAALSEMNRRMDLLEGTLRRGQITAADGPAGSAVYDRSPEAKAYFNYLRFGTRDEINAGHKALDRNEAKALTVGSDPTAGYLAPNEFVREIIRGEVEFSPLREAAQVRQTARRAIQLPKRQSSFGARWTSESGLRSETEGLSFAIEEIATHELYALVDVSEQMMEDSEFNLENELAREFSEQFAVAEGLAFVIGNGVGKPEGVLANPAVAESVSGSAASIADANGQADGLIDLYHAVKTQYAVRGQWLLNRATLSEVRKLKDAQGGYIWQPGLADGTPNTILGQPYVEVPDMPDVAADSYPIVFGDLRRGYTIVDRISLSILRDPFTQATNGNIRFIARRRVGGQVVLAEALRKLKVSV